MAGDMIAFGARRATVFPPASETEIVRALAANMVIAEMVVEGLWVGLE
jgi:TRAP-type C4-dicarboxylate transport system permease large subunit